MTPHINPGRRLLARAVRARDAQPELLESAWQRGAMDAQRWSEEHTIGFTLALAGPGGAVGAAVAAFAADWSLAPQIAAGAVGALAGAVLGVGGLLALMCVRAPIRQRDEAREQLRQHERTDTLTQLAADLEAFVVATRATAPRPPLDVMMEFGLKREDRSRLMAERNSEVDRFVRDMLRKYHESYRARIIEALSKPGREPLLDARGDLARNPKSVWDIEKLSATIGRLSRAQAERPGALSGAAPSTRLALARELRTLAGEMESFLEMRDDEARRLEQQLYQQIASGAITQADHHAVRKRVEKHRRETKVTFYWDFRERGLELFDRVHAIGLVGRDERERIDHPGDELEKIAPWLRDLATDLDGQAS